MKKILIMLSLFVGYANFAQADLVARDGYLYVINPATGVMKIVSYQNREHVMMSTVTVVSNNLVSREGYLYIVDPETAVIKLVTLQNGEHVPTNSVRTKLYP